MAKIQLLLCFTILFASVALLDVVSATLKIKPSLGDIQVPKTVKEVEPYTVKVVMVFVTDLEKQCPQTSKFKAFFERLRAYARFVCPLKRFDQTYERDMKAKAGSLFQTISSFAVGKIRDKIQEEKMEAVNNFRMMKTIAGKIIGGRTENEDSMTLTAEQQKEIKEGILKWETVISKITETMIESTTTSSSSSEVSTNAKGTSSESSGFKDTSGSNSNLGSPSGSPKNNPSGAKDVSGSGKEASFKDTTGGSKISPSGSKTTSEDTSAKSSTSSGKNSFADTTGKSSGGSPKGSPTMETSSKDTATAGSKTASNGSSMNTPSKETSSKGATTTTTTDSSTSTSGASQKSISVTQVEDESSKEIMTFIMNLEKKCPQKEEYKSFFEKLKTTMTGSANGSPRGRGGILYGIKHAAGKLGEAMQFMRARIGIRSAQVKESLENYQAEVMKAVEELDAIHQKIMSENKSKQGGSVTITAQQQTEIKQTITRWEKVTTQFVETAVQSESSSSSSTSTSSASAEKKMQAN